MAAFSDKAYPTAHPDDAAGERLVLRMARGLAVAWVFALVLGLSAYTQDAMGPIKCLLTSGICVAIALLCCVHRFTAQGPPDRQGGHVLGWSLLVFVVAYMVAVYFSAWPWQSFMAVAPWFNFILFAMLLPRVCTNLRQVEQVLIAAVFAIALSSVYGLCQRYGYDPFPWSITDRYEYTGLPATYGHPNFAGHVLIIGILLAVGMSWYVPGHKRPLPFRMLLLAAGVLMLTHLHFTGMRAGWLALFGAGGATFAAMLLKRVMGKGPWFPVAVLGGGMGIAAAGVGALAVALGRWPETRLDIDSSWILRLNGWMGSVELFADKPWLGAGPGTFRDAIVPYWTAFEQRWFIQYDMRNNHAHNEFLEAGVEAGIFGVAATVFLFLAMLYTALQLACSESARVRRFGWTSFAAIVAILIDAQFGFNLHTPVAAGLFFLMAGALIAVTPCTGPALPVHLRWHPALSGLVLTLLLFVAASQHYYVEWKYQRAQGAREWAYRLAATQPELAEPSARAALSELEIACRFPFAGVRHWDALGLIRLERGDPEGAAEAYREAVARAPFDPALLARVAGFLLDNFDDSNARLEAEALATRSALFCPGLAEAEHTLGRLRFAAHPKALPESESQRLLNEAIEHFRLANANARQPQVDYAVALVDAIDARRAFESSSSDEVSLVSERMAVLTATLRSLPGESRLWERMESGEPTTALARELCEAALVAASPPSYLPDLAVRAGGGYVRRALERLPYRLVLWGAMAKSVEPMDNVLSLLEARERLGVCDPATEQALGPMDALLAALSRGDGDALALAVEGVSEQAGRALALSRDVSEEDWRWLARLTEGGLLAGNHEAESAARVQLRLASLYRQLSMPVDAAVLSGMAEPFLEGAERGAALLYISQALSEDGDDDAALRRVTQAAVLAPFATEVRLHLAQCLADAGRWDEADFEYAGLLARLGTASAEGRAVAAAYAAFKEERAKAEGAGNE